VMRMRRMKRTKRMKRMRGKGMMNRNKRTR
jgi:hypothetical protein